MYAPVNPSNKTMADNSDKFYTDLQETMDGISKKDMIVLMGDFNARVSQPQHPTAFRTVGSFVVDVQNENGGRLINQLTSKMKLNDKQIAMIPKIQTLSTPVLYALLNDKKAYTYTLLFRPLKRAAREMKMNFSPSRIITDFEKGMMTTVKKQVSVYLFVHDQQITYFSDFFLCFFLFNFLKQHIKDVYFHLYQAMSKKLKKFGLWTYYTKNNDLHLFLKNVMAIVLLIPSLMDDAFESLRNEYLENKKLKTFTEPLTKFMLYVNKQWLQSEMRIVDI
ncbi:unnamed protein product [Rotaria sp. Silwood2]|nr:unnamed protein product [Rotaria sp. Silwood2]